MEINVSLRFYVKNLQTRLLCGLADLDLAMIFRKLDDFFTKKIRTLWEIDTRPVRRGGDFNHSDAHVVHYCIAACPLTMTMSVPAESLLFLSCSGNQTY